MDIQVNNKKVTAQKLRGGYYTPIKIAEYLSSWAIKDDECKILEPSVGDGNFIIAALQASQIYKKKVSIVAVEIENAEISKAKNRVTNIDMVSQITWICDDFFIAYDKLKKSEKFDVVLGNPPFIRFQRFEEKSREIAFAHLRDAGYKPNKLYNTWVAFVELSIQLLKDGGKLAMVLPAELLQVNYASELRKKLSKCFSNIVIIGFKKIIFPEIQQEIVLLLAKGKKEENDQRSDIQTIEYENGDDLLEKRDKTFKTISHIPTKHSRNGMKWTSLFLSNSAFKALDKAQKHSSLLRLGHYADVNVGIVTGQNSYFLLRENVKEELDASDYVTIIIGKTSALQSINFTEEDFNIYKQKFPAYLLDFTGIEYEALNKQVKDYIRLGETKEINLGYKCRIRPRWYDVPSIYVPDGFLFRQIHKFPLLVINNAAVTSTDTIHRVRFKKPVNKELFSACFFNSLTLAWSEVCGRSYGGGVLELEPREAIELPIPYSSAISLDHKKVEYLLRIGSWRQALDYVDKVVLIDYLGFDFKIVKNIRNAWIELRDRRNNRKNGATNI